MTHAPPQTMVVSYGARDEDDEYDSENERQRGLFGMLQQNKRGSQGQIGGSGGGGGGLGSMIEKLGASMTFTKDGNDSDEDSVVVRTFKKVGKKMKKMGKKRNKDDDDDESSSSEEESSDEEDSDSDDDEEETSEDDSEMEDRSISKRVGKAAMKMTGKFTKGFLGRSKDDSISSDEEEDPLFNMDNNNNNNRKNNFGFSFGKKKQDGEIQASSERRRRASEHSTPAFRRSNTDGLTAKRGPGRSKSTDHTYYEDMKKKNLARSHTQEAPRSPRKERTFAKSEAGLNRAAARAKAQEEFMEPAEAVWSMNVTEKMLEEAAKKGEFVPPAAGRRNKC